MKRLLYFGYFVKKTDYGQLKNSFKKTKENFALPYGNIFVDMIISSFKYGSSFHDYFMFEFHNKTHEEKNNYLTTARSYEFYTTMNEKREIAKFRNKAKFNMLFEEFIKRDYLFLDDADEESFTNWIADKTHIIAKSNEGTTGKGIERLDVSVYSASKIGVP